MVLKLLFVKALFLSTVLVSGMAWANNTGVSFKCFNDHEDYVLSSILNSDQMISQILHQEFIPDHKGNPSLDYESVSEVSELSITQNEFSFSSEESNTEIISYSYTSQIQYKTADTFVYLGQLSYLTSDGQTSSINMTCEVEL